MKVWYDVAGTVLCDVIETDEPYLSQLYASGQLMVTFPNKSGTIRTATGAVIESVNQVRYVKVYKTLLT